MKIRSFIIAYALVLAILLFADRRPGASTEDRYSRVVDLTDGQSASRLHTAGAESRTRIIAPGALIPGTWAAGQIPPERLVAPLVVLDLNDKLNSASGPQISLDYIAAWEAQHGIIPQGAVVAIRRTGAKGQSKTDLSLTDLSPTDLSPIDPSITPSPFPITRDAADFLIDARYTIGFAVETPVDFSLDRTLARQLALHGSYVVEGTAPFTSLPATGSLIIVAPAKNKRPGEAPVRVLAMVR
jgi:kynurenine formamidase